MWGEQGQCVLKPKSHGSGIMVSDFIDEHNGYLRLTDEEFIQAVDKVDGLQKEAHAFLEYGKEHEGYWTAKKFLSQLKDFRSVQVGLTARGRKLLRRASVETLTFVFAAKGKKLKLK